LNLKLLEGVHLDQSRPDAPAGVEKTPMDQPEGQAPIACTLDAGEVATRLAWIAALNTASLLDCRRDDLRLELLYAPDARDDVLKLVQSEQACCAFLTFEVREERRGLRVIIEAPEAARDAAMFVFAPLQAGKPGKTSCGCCGGAS
jgi:hypothetical protein